MPQPPKPSATDVVRSHLAGRLSGFPLIAPLHATRVMAGTLAIAEMQQRDRRFTGEPVLPRGRA